MLNKKTKVANLIKLIKKNFTHKDTFYILRSSRNLVIPDIEKPLRFGHNMSTHMLEIDYVDGEWDRPLISEYHNLSIDPRNSTLHYSITLFEGMKAYKDQNGVIRLFRPNMNFERMNRSADRLCLPHFEPEELTSCLGELLKIDEAWVPSKFGFSLYIRPTMISMHNILGVHAPKSAKLFVVCSIVGPYFKSGLKPLKIVTSVDNRSYPGGFGGAKIGANYGPTLQYYDSMIKKGYQQVLWLVDDKLSEIGVMNMFVLHFNEEGEKELITCPLDGSVLPGVTRDSIIKIAKEWGIDTVEEYLTIQDLLKEVKKGKVIEVFGCGTACTVAPIGQITHNDQVINLLEDFETAPPFCAKLNEYIMSIQYGSIEHEWSHKVL